MEFKHLSVMFNECMESLNLKSDGIYFDGTLGGGGHALGILSRTAPKGFLVATDRDSDAIDAASERLKDYRSRLKVVKDNFKNFKKVVDNECNINEFLSVINRPNKYVSRKILPPTYSEEEIMKSVFKIPESWKREKMRETLDFKIEKQILLYPSLQAEAWKRIHLPPSV